MLLINLMVVPFQYHLLSPLPAPQTNHQRQILPLPQGKGREPKRMKILRRSSKAPFCILSTPFASRSSFWILCPNGLHIMTAKVNFFSVLLSFFFPLIPCDLLVIFSISLHIGWIFTIELAYMICLSTSYYSKSGWLSNLMTIKWTYINKIMYLYCNEGVFWETEGVFFFPSIEEMSRAIWTNVCCAMHQRTCTPIP